MIRLFWRLLPAALMCVDGGSRKPSHVAAAFIAYLIDLYLARTFWKDFAGPLQGAERTISDTLERLCLDVNNPDWPLYYSLAQRINRLSPTGAHIKAARNERAQ